MATSATPEDVEAGIAAAEQRLAMAGVSEAARPVDALTEDPVTGVLADDDASAAMAQVQPRRPSRLLTNLEVGGGHPEPATTETCPVPAGATPIATAATPATTCWPVT